MKVSVVTISRSARGPLAPALAGALLVGLSLLGNGLLAQNNDNGGILPGMPGGQGMDLANGHDAVLAVAGQMEADATDASLPSLRVTVPGLAVAAAAFGVAEEEAEFTSLDGAVLAEQLPTGALALQDSGLLNPEIGLGLSLHSAGEALVRAAVLIGSDADQPLGDLLSGVTAPLAMIALGDLPSIDLVVLAKLLHKHHDEEAPMRVSIVFVSIDPMGAKRLGAVSGLTGGGGLQLAFE